MGKKPFHRATVNSIADDYSKRWKWDDLPAPAVAAFATLGALSTMPSKHERGSFMADYLLCVSALGMPYEPEVRAAFAATYVLDPVGPFYENFAEVFEEDAASHLDEDVAGTLKAATSYLAVIEIPEEGKRIVHDALARYIARHSADSDPELQPIVRELQSVFNDGIPFKKERTTGPLPDVSDEAQGAVERDVAVVAV